MEAYKNKFASSNFKNLWNLAMKTKSVCCWKPFMAWSKLFELGTHESILCYKPMDSYTMSLITNFPFIMGNTILIIYVDDILLTEMTHKIYCLWKKNSPTHFKCLGWATLHCTLVYSFFLNQHASIYTNVGMQPNYWKDSTWRTMTPNQHRWTKAFTFNKTCKQKKQIVNSTRSLWVASFF